jgi:cytochrome c550
MRTLSVVVLLSMVSLALEGSAAAQAAPTAQEGAAGAAAPVGDAAAGKAVWALGNTSCRNCHGGDAEGGFGPALAGRKLPLARVQNYIRNPIGRMPAYVPEQLLDKEIVDLVAYFDSLPPVPKAGPWRTELPAGAPRGQQLAISTIGCGQCHGATLETPRHGMGEVNGDFEWFKRMVYDHVNTQKEQWSQLDPAFPAVTPSPAGPIGRARMGVYSKTRLPEATLQEIFNWANDLGALVPMTGRVSTAADTKGTTYSLDVTNAGVAGKGLTAEDVTIALAVPADAKVVGTTGVGYEGIKADAEAKGSVAVWHVSRFAPHERQMFTITLAGAPAAGAAAAGAPPKGTIRWAKPSAKADDVVDIVPARRRP